MRSHGPIGTLAVLAIALFSDAATSQHLQPARVVVDGLELHYAELGRGEPIIFLHGGSGDYRAWEPQLMAFAPNYRAISYSRRYNYPNNNPDVAKNYSADIDADDLAAFIRKLSLGRVHLVGISYGAFTALMLALKHPDLVRSLVLAEPPVHQLIRDTRDGEAAYQQFLAKTWKPAADAFTANNEEAAMRILSDGISGAGAFDSFSQARRATMMQNARAFKALTLSTNPFPDIAADNIKRVHIPALIITGQNTTRIHRLDTEKLAGLLPNAESVVIPNAGHGSNRDNPTAFNRAVTEFLSKQKS